MTTDVPPPFPLPSLQLQIFCRGASVIASLVALLVALSIHLAGGLAGAGVHEQGNDQAVKTWIGVLAMVRHIRLLRTNEKHTEDFSENENKNHSDEESGLLSSTTDTGITDNTDGETSGKTGKADGETSTELDETGVQGLLLGELVGDQDGNDETVNGNDTSHNDGNNVLESVSICALMLAMEEGHADCALGRMIADILPPSPHLIW